MTPRQRAALDHPCRRQEELERPEFVSVRECCGLTFRESLSIVIEPAPGGNFVPRGLDGAAWRASVEIGSADGETTLPTSCWTPGHYDLAQAGLAELLVGVGDPALTFPWRSHRAVYVWRGLRGDERDLLPVPVPVPEPRPGGTHR